MSQNFFFKFCLLPVTNGAIGEESHQFFFFKIIDPLTKICHPFSFFGLLEKNGVKKVVRYPYSLLYKQIQYLSFLTFSLLALRLNWFFVKFFLDFFTSGLNNTPNDNGGLMLRGVLRKRYSIIWEFFPTLLNASPLLGWAALFQFTMLSYVFL